MRHERTCRGSVFKKESRSRYRLRYGKTANGSYGSEGSQRQKNGFEGVRCH